jgi:hypothetical protein
MLQVLHGKQGPSYDTRGIFNISRYGGDIMTLELDCEKYVEAVTGPANAWGACLVDGIPSHTFLGIMFDKYGQDMVDAYLKDNYWSKK